jgi:hypothetical protein
MFDKSGVLFLEITPLNGNNTSKQNVVRKLYSFIPWNKDNVLLHRHTYGCVPI